VTRQPPRAILLLPTRYALVLWLAVDLPARLAAAARDDGDSSGAARGGNTTVAAVLLPSGSGGCGGEPVYLEASGVCCFFF